MTDAQLDRVLYPQLEPYEVGHVQVDSRHRLYWEQTGNPEGFPVLYVHGGPGDGTRPLHRRFYDPARCRIIIFHQRGAGHSTPHADLTDNTTAHLVADIERVREALGVSRWLVTGGSWGSCLSLAYAIEHPERCLGLVLRAIFLGRPVEIDWWFNGVATLFPDHHQRFREFIPVEERGDLLAAYYRRLVDPDPAVHMPAALSLKTLSACTVSLQATEEAVRAATLPAQSLALARTFTHYCAHRFFMPDDHILANAARYRHLPMAIVQGRYDVVSPARTAWDLYQAVPDAEVTIVPQGGHSIDEAPMAQALVAAADRMLNRLFARA